MKDFIRSCRTDILKNISWSLHLEFLGIPDNIYFLCERKVKEKVKRGKGERKQTHQYEKYVRGFEHRAPGSEIQDPDH